MEWMYSITFNVIYFIIIIADSIGTYIYYMLMSTDSINIPGTLSLMPNIENSFQVNFVFSNIYSTCNVLMIIVGGLWLLALLITNKICRLYFYPIIFIVLGILYFIL